VSYQTEEEQLARIGQLWKQYGNKILTLIIIIAVGFYAYKAWLRYESTQAEQASALYQQLIQLNNNVDPSASMSKEQMNSFNHIVSLLKKDYASSIYTQYAELLQAKQSMLAHQPDSAKAALNSVIKTSSDDNIKALATIRLATILIGEGKSGAAKALNDLKNLKQTGAFTVSYQETLGDAYLAMNQINEARAAYQQGLTVAKKDNVQRPLIQIKLDNIVQPGEQQK